MQQQQAHNKKNTVKKNTVKKNTWPGLGWFPLLNANYNNFGLYDDDF